MDLKLCPKCKKLPDVIIRKRWFGHECVIHCETLGCKMFWPLVATGFNKEKVKAKAAALWNDAVDAY